MLHLGHILEAICDYQATGAEPALSSVVTDSREAQPGALFVALPGAQVDGHDFAPDAFSRGAIAALAARPLPGDYLIIDARPGQAPAPVVRPAQPLCLLVDDTALAMQTAAQAWRNRFDVKVIGITGSVGKSSTKELAHAVLAQRYRTLKTPGNRNSVLGLPPALFELRPYHQRAILEMGMYTTGEIARLCEIARPTVGVLTIVGPVHLERAGSIENITRAKRELVEALPPDGVAILNKDDARVMGMAGYTQARIFTYGLDRKADLWADNIRSMGLDGLRFTLHHRREALSVRVPLLGRHSVHTALRAAAVGLVEQLSWEEIVAGLASSQAQLRLVAVPGPKGSIIIDDTYNSSPDSAMAALNLLEDLDGRRIAVLGDMLELGQAEIDSHRLVGRRAADVAHTLLAVGPRARLIAAEAQAVGMPAERVFWVAETSDAIPVLEEVIEPRDVVLIKGSLGMRMDRIVAALGRDS
jgi:UDP-N-acetylmuramoyl-tripeptide--D-alanyl-D-alanine ligase